MPSKVELYERFAWPIIRRFSRPNAAHDRIVALAELIQPSPIALRLFERVFAQGGRRYSSERLKVTLGGVALDNPILLPAGFDKDGRCVETLYRLGFGAIVVGTALKDPQPGNPRPNIFRPTPESLLNRMGLPCQGMVKVKENLGQHPNTEIPIGISVGVNEGLNPSSAPEAYAAVVEMLYDLGAFFALNVSCPNVAGLRELQDKEHLVAIIQAILEAMAQAGGAKPLFVKISPDLPLTAVDEVIEVMLVHHLSGIIATNTTTDETIKASLGARWAQEEGGVSGFPLRALSTSRVRHIYKETQGHLDIIGSGGIHDLDSALEKILAGAKALAVYTGLITKGPALPTHLNRQLDAWMQQQGVSHIQEVVGQHA